MRLTVTNEQMKKAEINADKNGVPFLQLMKNAGDACFSRINSIMNGVKDKNVVILAGRGNNGGDGIVLTDLMLEAGANAILIFAQDLPKTETARLCYSIYETGLNSCIYAHQKENVKKVLENCEIVVDCVFGTGFHGELEESLRDLFRFINECCPATKFSVDVPSGCNSDTGEIAADAFKPDFTITLGAVKKGLYSHPCFEHCGVMLLADIGIEQSCYDGCEAVLTDEIILEFIPKRPAVSHKGTYGRLLNLAGSGRYTGAALLSTDAALKMGTGLCTLATPMRVVNAIAAAVPETTFLPLSHDKNGFIDREGLEELKAFISENKFTAIAAGCGLGKSEIVAEAVEFIIKNADCPVILDADGLNSISSNINILKENKKGVVITPHPAEFARLTGRTVEEIQRDRITLAKDFAAEYNTVTVLKGTNTVIAAPKGECFVNTTGNAGLAKGGSGDVLTGIIASLMAQGADLFYGTALGVYLHGQAADRLRTEKQLFGIMPRDIMDAVTKLNNSGKSEK
ncbi:MAG: NAD(P)H-hydrate dehydratase [Ruminiclostridium sp.]|nr:NAD(P)H-hydrate dehydratase [Ruminiclostridium sp.]